MLGIDVKRGVSATMERVVESAGGRFGSLDVMWQGKTAGIHFYRSEGSIHAKVVFPDIDELKDIDKATFNNLIGFALHEGLGHAMFTDNTPWDNARTDHGEYVSMLINGLEDPRIEQKAIDSGYAPNAKMLFEDLLNAMLKRDGYVDPQDFKNIPFMLAVEGRRLNGYRVSVPCIVDQYPFASAIWSALHAARDASDTTGVVKAALRLREAIRAFESQASTQAQGDPKESPADDSDASEGQSGDDQPDDEQSDDDQDAQGCSGGQDDQHDEDAPERDSHLIGGRSVEPDDFIKSELSPYKLRSDRNSPRPIVGKPITLTFHWK